MRRGKLESGTWILPAILGFLAAAGMALFARGMAGDEEVTHFLIARYAPEDPRLFLSVSGRPLVTLSLALPAQMGFVAGRLASAVATGLCAAAVARMALQTRWVHPLLAVAFLLIQPFYLAHAGTNMTEPWAAMILAWGLLAFVERRYWLLAVLAAIAPLARMETLALWPLVAWTLIGGRHARSLLLFPLPLLIWNFLGTAATGDWIWLLHQSSWQAYPQRDVLHYAKSYVWIVGLGLYVPVLVALWRSAFLWQPFRGDDIAGEKALRETRQRTTLGSGVMVLAFFAVYTVLASWQPATYGNLRYFAYAAPALAMLAALGIHALQREPRRQTGPALALAAIGGAFLWDHPLRGDFAILTLRDYVPFGVAVAWIALFLLPRKDRWLLPTVAVLLGVAVLPMRYQGTLHLRPTPEHAAVLQARLMLEPLPADVQLYAAHPVLAFYRNENLYDQDLYPPITDRLTENATPGSLFFWDTHYALPKGRSLEVGNFLNNPAWRYLSGVVAKDSTWVGGYFLRVNPDDSTYIAASKYVRNPELEAPWKHLAIVVQSGIPAGQQNVRADPTNAAYWRTLGQRFATVKLFDEAEESLRRASELEPWNAYNHAYQAEVFRFKGDLPGALEEAKKALALEPEDGNFQYQTGRLLIDLGHKDEAIPYLVRGAELLPKRWDIQFTTGKVLYTAQDWTRAEQFLLATQVLRPGHVEAAMRAAEISWRLGRKDEALERLRAFIRIRPSETVPYVILGDLLVSSDRVDEARELWTTGLKETGGDPDIASRLRSLDP